MKIAMIFLLPFLLLGCARNANLGKEKEGLLSTDQEFSAFSEKNGMKKAFLAYVDSNCVLLRSNHMPVRGVAAIREYFSKFSDAGFTLVWEPLYAEVSGSGDMGYSYGISTFIPKDTAEKPEKGTYVTVWKKDREGKWKFILDTGNSGIAPKAKQ